MCPVEWGEPRAKGGLPMMYLWFQRTCLVSTHSVVEYKVAKIHFKYTFLYTITIHISLSEVNLEQYLSFHPTSGIWILGLYTKKWFTVTVLTSNHGPIAFKYMLLIILFPLNPGDKKIFMIFSSTKRGVCRKLLSQGPFLKCLPAHLWDQS